MERIVWDPSFDTGLDAMDEEHRALADLVAALANAATGPAEAAREAADRLATAAAAHFAHEERLMDETDYPLARRHKQIHAALLKQLGAVRERLASGHAWHAGTMALFAEDFLFHHVDREDRPLARHALKRRAAPGA